MNYFAENTFIIFYLNIGTLNAYVGPNFHELSQMHCKSTYINRSKNKESSIASTTILKNLAVIAVIMYKCIHILGAGCEKKLLLNKNGV